MGNFVLDYWDAMQEAATNAQKVMEQPAQASAAPVAALNLSDLPGHVLIQVLACLPLRDARALVATCRTFLHLANSMRSIHAAARATKKLNKPGRRLDNYTQNLLKRTHCTPQAAGWLRGCLGGPVSVLLNPTLACWLMEYAAYHGDWDTVDWVLRITQPTAAITLRQKYRHLYDLAWVNAAGGAAAGQQWSLFQHLTAVPCAPGQPHGLRQLGSDLHRQLLCAAITGHDTAAALAAVKPLCWLPEQLPASTAARVWPWDAAHQSSQFHQARTQQHQVGLLEAMCHAMRHGYGAALQPLQDAGVDVFAHWHQLTQASLADDNGVTLYLLLKLQNPRSPWQTVGLPINAVHSTWRNAVSNGKRSIVMTLLDCAQEGLFSCPLTTRDIRQLLSEGTPWALDLTKTILQHPATPIDNFRANTDHVQHAVELDRQRFLALLLAHGFRWTEGAAQQAAVLGRPLALQALLQDAQCSLSAANLVQYVYDAARVFEKKGEGGLRQRHCAHLLLHHLLQLPTTPPALAQVYLGHKKEDTPPLTPKVPLNLWPATTSGQVLEGQFLEALLILGEVRLLCSVLACLRTVHASEALLQRVAGYCARQPDKSPSLLLEFVGRGAAVTDALHAVVGLPQPCMRLAERLLDQCHVLAQAEETHSAETRQADAQQEPAQQAQAQCVTEGPDSDQRAGCEAEAQSNDAAGSEQGSNPWARVNHRLPELVTAVAKVAGDTGCPHAYAVLERLIHCYQGNPAQAVLVPKSAGDRDYRSKHHLALLKWLLGRFSLEQLGLAAGPAADSEEVIAKLEDLGCFLLLPHLAVVVSAGVPREPVISGMCRRMLPPLRLLRPLLQGLPLQLSGPPVGATEPSAAAAGAVGTPVAAMVDGNWQQGRLMQHAVCSRGSTELLDLLISAGCTDWAAALQDPQANPELLLHLVSKGTPMTDSLACTILGKAQSGSEALARLLEAGLQAADALMLACKAGSKDAVAALVQDHQQDATMLCNQPILLAAQHGHQAVVELLLGSGACVHTALYGAALGGVLAMGKWLLQQGADPGWDGGAAVTAALSAGNEKMVNLLIPDPQQ